MPISGATVRKLTNWEVQVIVTGVLFCYWAPWLPRACRTAWLEAASWGALHGLHDLQTSSRVVTIAVASVAVLGLFLKLIPCTKCGPRMVLRQIGLFATSAPLSVLMPAPAAALYLGGLVTIASLAWLGSRHLNPPRAPRQSYPKRLLGESFSILSAVCFVTMSWQYNAQWLTRGLLIAGGASLLARAALPFQNQAPSLHASQM